ncbi:MAG TPA: prepilin-type N-terminal cleavage/methylation domain-containing protein [Bryobacteraceae bacterium]|nr:prepilin-type N-terminal cleavage/methylation domain-containing protein [Bryobacteraceae bacterium]
MPTSSTGNRARAVAGVTLMEMMVVLVIIALIVGISLPSTLAGLDNIRLSSGARSVAAFMNSAANRAERRQQAIELFVFVKESAVSMRSPEPGFLKKLNLPQGIIVRAVWPAAPEDTDEPRVFLFLPGGVPPRIGIELANKRGARRIVRLNPITGVAEIEQPPSS